MDLFVKCHLKLHIDIIFIIITEIDMTSLVICLDKASLFCRI